MKKILGLALQCTSLIILGYTFLNTRLVLVADWLSPMLSSKIYSFFTLLFLVLGDSIKHPELVMIWGLSAMLLGIVIRRPIGSIFSIIVSWLFIVSLTVVLGLGLFAEANENLVYMEGVDLFEALPPLPPGLTITELLETPVVGELMDYMLNLVNTQPESIELFMIFNQLGDLFILSLVSKPVIAAFFSLIGVLLGKKVEHLLDLTITDKRFLLKKRLVKDATLLVLILVLACMAPVSAITSNLYTENLATVITPEGQVFVAGVFAENSLYGIDNEVFVFDGFVGCVIASHRNIMDIVYTYMPFEEADRFNMLGILPETLVFFFYIDTEQGAAIRHSELVAHELSRFYEMEILDLFCFTQEVDDSGFPHMVTVNIYHSPLRYEAFYDKYLKNYQSYGGYVNSIRGDILLPGKTAGSVDGSLLFSCYIKPDFVYYFMQIDPLMGPFDLDIDLLGVAGFVGYWDNYAGIIDDVVSIEEVFNLESELDYAWASDFSSTTIIVPDVDGGPILQLSTSLPFSELLSEMIIQELGKMGVKTEIVLDQEATTRVTLGECPFPLNLNVDREIWQTGPDTLNVQIRVTNLDKVPAYDIVIDDSTSFKHYMCVESIGSTYQEIHILGPGETHVFEYKVKMQNQGSYTLLPVHLSYRDGENSFDTRTKPTSIQVDRPSGFENFGNTVSMLLEVEDGLSEYLPENISIGIQLSTYAVILYTILCSVVNLRRWILS